MSLPGGFTSTRAAWRAAAGRLVFGVVVVAGLWLTVLPTGGAGRGGQLALAAAAVCGLLLAGRWAVAAVMVTMVATTSAWMLGVTADPFVLTAVALFVVAERQGSQRFPWWMLGAGGGVAVAALGLSAEGVENRFRGMLLGALVLGASWFLGVRTRQVHEEAAARSRAEERLRLARDVHDVLSHSLGTIGMRAGIAAHVPTLGEAELRAVLREVEEGARSSLAELKGVLQRERAGGEELSAPFLSAQSLAAQSLSAQSLSAQSLSAQSLSAALADTARSAERADVRTRLDLTGDLDELPAAVRTTVYRLVQEAVTNAVRHASATSLVITARAAADRVHLEVRDDGRGAAPGFREGHGLTGMRERVALLGGTLQLETVAPGFGITVTLPLATPAQASGLS
ncbi:sensor histidine kinase [Cryobacterium sp. W22_MBD10_FK3]|uniref:sensor histidine kinase n=1 Tax=Cryobacterium sp. W22_MBD10_FK3 TaxID=3240273 RepID=UPI003F90FD69